MKIYIGVISKNKIRVLFCYPLKGAPNGDQRDAEFLTESQGGNIPPGPWTPQSSTVISLWSIPN